MATIVNNEATTTGSKFRVSNPLFYVPDPAKSGSLGLAKLYFGEPSKDPLLPENQKRVYVVQADGSFKAINQPVRTTAGGVPEYNGSPALLAIDGNYSYKALSSENELAYNSSNIDNLSLSESGILSIISDTVRTTLNQVTITFPNVDLGNSVIDISSSELVDPSLLDSRRLIRDVDFSITDGGNGVITLVSAFPAGTLVTARQNASTNQTSRLPGVLRMFSIPLISDALPIDFIDGDVVRITSGELAGDGLANDYEVVPSTTGTADGVNLIQLDNLKLLRLNKTRNKFQTYTEANGTASISSGVLNIDVNKGLTQDITLTENVSSITIGNVNTEGATSLTLRLIQDTNGSRSVSFSGFIADSGSPPAISSGAGEIDILVFNNFGGSDFYVFSAGYNFSVIT